MNDNIQVKVNHTNIYIHKTLLKFSFVLSPFVYLPIFPRLAAAKMLSRLFLYQPKTFVCFEKWKFLWQASRQEKNMSRSWQLMVSLGCSKVPTLSQTKSRSLFSTLRLWFDIWSIKVASIMPKKCRRRQASHVPRFGIGPNKKNPLRHFIDEKMSQFIFISPCFQHHLLRTGFIQICIKAKQREFSNVF